MGKEVKPETSRYNENSIGIIGGVGPFAGLDLMSKILSQTRIQTEQDHLPITLLSYANKVPDRTAYLLGRIEENPADEIFKIIQNMAKVGVSVAAIACNTAHVSKIYEVVKEKLATAGHEIKLLHLVEVTINYIKEHFPDLKKIGVLSTSGSYTFQLYERFIKNADLTAIRIPENLQDTLVHASIYDAEYGIKITSPKVNPMAINKLKEAAGILVDQGAEAIIMGCSEIPFALTEKKINKTWLIDPNWIMARALILEFDPNKLTQL